MKIIFTIASAFVAIGAVATTAKAEHVQRALIVGGEEVQVGSKPYTVGLRTAAAEASFCAGSLIASNYVLTTAYCASLDPKFVAVGTHYLSGTEDGEQIMVTSVIVHPWARNETDLHDFALLRLERSSIYPSVALPVADIPIEPGLKVESMGWGSTAYKRSPSNVLRIVDLVVREDQECSPHYRYGTADMCAGGDSGKDLCGGDSGAPLIFTNRGGFDILIGMSNRGQNCGLEGLPGVFARVPLAVGWIDEVMKTMM